MSFSEFELPLSGIPDEKFNYVGQVNYRVKSVALDLLNANDPNGASDFFGELKIKKTEEELASMFGKEVGKLLFEEAVCEDKFP